MRDRQHDNAISAIRFIAMLMIITCHFMQYLNIELAWWFNVGVQLFFVISGFLYGGKTITDQALKIETLFFKKYIKKLFRNMQFDVSVGFMQGEPSDVAMSCINAKKRIVFYRHGTIFEFLNDKKYYSKADRVVALSEGVKNDLIVKRDVPEKKIEIIHNVYDIDSIIEKSKEYCEFDGEKRIKLVTVARISPEKGILQAIQTAKLLKDNDIDFLWLFVGKNEGDYYEKCKQTILRHGLERNIVFTGVQTNEYLHHMKGKICLSKMYLMICFLNIMIGE